MGKTSFCIWENKGADQLRGNHEADLRLCFCYIDSICSSGQSESVAFAQVYSRFSHDMAHTFRTISEF